MMNKLRQDLRAVFDRQQEGLGELAGSRQRVLRSALEKRDEPIGRRTQLVAGIAAAVMAVVVVATFAYVRAGNQARTVVPGATSPTPNSPNFPTHLSRYDIDLLDSANAWTLLSDCDPYSANPCSYFVTATVDGGRTWSKPVQVGPSYETASGDAPRMIRFINAADGFVYGTSGAFVTHDGGKTWSSLDFHATFFSLISGHGRAVWAFTYPCPKGTLCSYDARSSNDGGRSWSAPKALPVGFSPFEASFFGSTGLVLSGKASGQIAMTSDNGKTWRSINSQCKDPYAFSARVATSDGNELWMLCMGYPKVPNIVGSSLPEKPSPPPGPPDSVDKVLFLSRDGGLSWSQKGTSLAGGNLPVLGTNASIVSIRPNELLLGTEKTLILRTTDGASSWTPAQTSPLGGVIWLRFTNPQIGWAMDVQGAIWSTTDGGASWMKLPGYHPAP